MDITDYRNLAESAYHLYLSLRNESYDGKGDIEYEQLEAALEQMGYAVAPTPSLTELPVTGHQAVPTPPVEAKAATALSAAMMQWWDNIEDTSLFEVARIGYAEILRVCNVEPVAHFVSIEGIGRRSFKWLDANCRRVDAGEVPDE
jgi:hypothetical protein